MIRITQVATEAQLIEGIDGLDPVHVFWINVEPGKGYVTAICYGAAWTTYFGAMGGKTIQQFCAMVDVDYLVTKLMSNVPSLKSGKRHQNYLAKVVTAVKAAAAESIQSQETA